MAGDDACREAPSRQRTRARHRRARTRGRAHAAPQCRRARAAAAPGRAAARSRDAGALARLGPRARGLLAESVRGGGPPPSVVQRADLLDLLERALTESGAR